MKTYYVPHKLKEGDVTHLANNDSAYLIDIEKAKIEDIIFIQSPNSIFSAVVTDIAKNSVEVEILELREKREEEKNLRLTVIQSILPDEKMKLIIEKLTEIGADEIILVQSELSLTDVKVVNRNFHNLERTLKEAKEQSRNPFPPQLNRPILLSKLSDFAHNKALKICFSTEEKNPENINIVKESNNIVIAFGPESGWGVKDLDVFKRNGFRFVKLKGNILRAETSSIIIPTIIKALKGEF